MYKGCVVAILFLTYTLVGVAELFRDMPGTLVHIPDNVMFGFLMIGMAFLLTGVAYSNKANE